MKLSLVFLAVSMIYGCAAMLPKPNGPREFIPVAKILEVPESDPFTLYEARVENDSLKMFVRYDGGCRDHTFSLYVSRSDSAKSTVDVYVWHNAHNDVCRALVEAYPVAFDLRGLRRELGMRGRLKLVSHPGQQESFSLTY